LLQALAAGADEALMLDPLGFIASCNSTNFFIVREGNVVTSTGRFSFKGITRGKVIDLAREAVIPVSETDFTLAEVYNADEAFVTGTFGGITPVRHVDGRKVGDRVPGVMTAQFSELYDLLIGNSEAT
jgi:branched-chain amino acid aminotransferase